MQLGNLLNAISGAPVGKKKGVVTGEIVTVPSGSDENYTVRLHSSSSADIFVKLPEGNFKPGDMVEIPIQQLMQLPSASESVSDLVSITQSSVDQIVQFIAAETPELSESDKKVIQVALKILDSFPTDIQEDILQKITGDKGVAGSGDRRSVISRLAQLVAEKIPEVLKTAPSAVRAEIISHLSDIITPVVSSDVSFEGIVPLSDLVDELPVFPGLEKLDLDTQAYQSVKAAVAVVQKEFPLSLFRYSLGLYEEPSTAPEKNLQRDEPIVSQTVQYEKKTPDASLEKPVIPQRVSRFVPSNGALKNTWEKTLSYRDSSPKVLSRLQAALNNVPTAEAGESLTSGSRSIAGAEVKAVDSFGMVTGVKISGSPHEVIKEESVLVLPKLTSIEKVIDKSSGVKPVDEPPAEKTSLKLENRAVGDERQGEGVDRKIADIAAENKSSLPEEAHGSDHSPKVRDSQLSITKSVTGEAGPETMDFTAPPEGDVPAEITPPRIGMYESVVSEDGYSREFRRFVATRFPNINALLPEIELSYDSKKKVTADQLQLLENRLWQFQINDAEKPFLRAVVTKAFSLLSGSLSDVSFPKIISQIEPVAQTVAAIDGIVDFIESGFEAENTDDLFVKHIFGSVERIKSNLSQLQELFNQTESGAVEQGGGNLKKAGDLWGLFFENSLKNGSGSEKPAGETSVKQELLHLQSEITKKMISQTVKNEDPAEKAVLQKLSAKVAEAVQRIEGGQLLAQPKENASVPREQVMWIPVQMGGEWTRLGIEFRREGKRKGRGRFGSRVNIQMDLKKMGLVTAELDLDAGKQLRVSLGASKPAAVAWFKEHEQEIYTSLNSEMLRSVILSIRGVVEGDDSQERKDSFQVTG